MNPEPLSNYLRMHRRRTPLSQDDIAFLLGSFDGARVSRHESAQRLPPVEVALAYEFIFGVPAREIYKGLNQKIENAVLRRAKILLESTQHRLNDQDHEKKFQTLKHLIESIEEKIKLRSRPM
jgi:transcriptional regulator with XRE-family HTH domain